MFDNEFFSLAPISFFEIKATCHYQEFEPKKELGNKFLLPDTSDLCHEESFAEVAMAWGKEGITVQVRLEEPFDHPVYPNIQQGDSVELFFDTRDVKTSGFNTRFCHHFFFLPEAVDGHQVGELTHFRTEDTHELCDSKQLIVTSSSKKGSFLKSSSTLLKIFIPSQCLYGYDPDQFDRLGFTYRINRHNGSPQHFSVVSQEFQIEQQPSLWSSVRLLK